MTSSSRPDPRALAAARRLLAPLLVAALAAPGLAGAQPAAKPATAGPAATAPVAAQDPHRRDDIARHRAIAAAHDTAARCLEGGQKESACHDALRKACEGIAVGRYCGMKHSH
jgi:hypothetical protein